MYFKSHKRAIHLEFRIKVIIYLCIYLFFTFLCSHTHHIETGKFPLSLSDPWSQKKSTFIEKKNADHWIFDWLNSLFHVTFCKTCGHSQQWSSFTLMMWTCGNTVSMQLKTSVCRSVKVQVQVPLKHVYWSANLNAYIKRTKTSRSSRLALLKTPFKIKIRNGHIKCIVCMYLECVPAGFNGESLR